RGGGAHPRPPGRRLRRGAGLPPGAGRGFAGRGRGPPPQHRRADRADRSRPDGLGRTACRYPLRRCPRPVGRRTRMGKPTTGTMPPLAEAMQRAELIHDRAAIEAAIEAMAERIVADYTALDATGPER